VELLNYVTGKVDDFKTTIRNQKKTIGYQKKTIRGQNKTIRDQKKTIGGGGTVCPAAIPTYGHVQAKKENRFY
jgi:hypothetical protein